jgi:hypothetical protein
VTDVIQHIFHGMFPDIVDWDLKAYFVACLLLTMILIGFLMMINALGGKR